MDDLPAGDWVCFKCAVAEAAVDIEPTDELSTPAPLGGCEVCKEVNREDAAEMVTCCDGCDGE